MLFPIPANVVRRQHDSVSYLLGSKDTTCKKFNNICYASHMHSLSENDFICIPHHGTLDWRTYMIDDESYLRFIDLFKQHRLISQKTKAYIEDSVPKLCIPKGTSRHR